MGAPTVTITSEGTKLAPGVGVVSVEVRRELNRVPEASLMIVDGSVAKRTFAQSNTEFFEPGKKVSIAVRQGSDEDTTLFEGLVVRHAVESRPGSTSLRVELKDASFKLTRQRKSTVFRDQADDEAIRKVIDDANLDVGDIEQTKPKHKELIQYYATDWDFIVSRADAQGLVVDAHLGKVSVQPMVSSDEPVTTLEHGMSGVDLDLEIDATEQWGQMASVAWDIAKLEPTAPSDAADPSIKVGNLDSGSIAKTLGGDSYTLVHPAPLMPDELGAWAKGRFARSRLSMLRGTASISGTADIAPRDIVDVAGVGDRFNGHAFVSAVTQTVDAHGWRTELGFGLPPEPFTKQSDIADIASAGLLPPVHGLHVGIVDKYEKDDSGEHRVKVLLAVLDKKQGAVWARLAKPEAGKNRGYVFWPEAGDEVVVGFLNGDPRQAIVLGALHGSKNSPPDPPGPPNKDNDQRAIVSKSGIVISLDDKKKAVRIETPGKNRIVIDDDAKSITLEDQHQNKITLDESGITLTSKKDFNIDAQGKVVIKGTSVDVK